MPDVTRSGEPPADWETWLAAAGREAGFCQSGLWARILRGVDEAEPVWLTAQGPGGAPAGRLLCVVQRPFDRALRRRLTVLEALRRASPTVLHWLDGPVVPDPREAAPVIGALLDAAEALARNRGVHRISGSSGPHTGAALADAAVREEFLRRGYRATPWATLLADLSPDEEAMFKAVDHSVRKAVKKCERSGVRVREVQGLDDFTRSYYEPYRAAEEAHGRAVNPPYVAEVSFREDTERRYRYFVAETAEGEVLATLGMYLFNGVATEVASLLTAAAYERKLPAQDLLHWEMFRAAKAAGCHTFDLAGVAPNPANPKEAGIRHFKEKWGGRYVGYETWDKPLGLWRALAPGRAWVARRLRRSH